MLRPNTIALTALLALLTGIAPLSVDMYLASLPDIGRKFAATDALVQFTLSFYLVGFAIGQVLYGPFSDRHGRKPVLLSALAIFTVASFFCAIAPSIEVLIAARFVQAVGGAGAGVLARAMVRDMYEGVSVGRELSRLAAVMALAPLIAPPIGGLLQTYLGWWANFILLAAVGIVTLALVATLLPETLRNRAPEPVSLGSILRAYRMFVGDARFLAYCGILVCTFAGLFAWISAAAFVLQNLYGLDALQFGLAFTAGSAGYLVGTWIAARVVMGFGLDRTLGIGCVALAGGGIACVAVLALGYPSIVGLVLSVSLFLCGLGLTVPQAQAGGLLPFPGRAGAASSLMGFAMQFSGAIAGALVVHLLDGSAWSLAIAVALSGCGSLAIWLFTRKLRAGPQSATI